MKIARAIAALSLLSLLSSCGGPTLFYFLDLRIDPGLTLRPAGPRFNATSEPHLPSYYSFFRGANLISVDHRTRHAGADRTEDALYLETNLQQRLDRTVKTENILQGPFGTVYSTRTCFYNRDANSLSSLAVAAWASNGGELPSASPQPPFPLPPPSSLHLVRILRLGPEPPVVVGNYEATGKLSGINMSGTKHGEWALTQDGGDFIIQAPADPRIARYGLPPTFDIAQYRLHPRLALAPTAFPDELIVLNQHFGFGQLIQQDTLANGSAVSTRFLAPSLTPEEKILNPLCDAAFQHQQATGLRTVQ